MCMHLYTVPLLRTFPLVSIVELRVDRSQSTQNRSAPAYTTPHRTEIIYLSFYLKDDMVQPS